MGYGLLYAGMNLGIVFIGFASSRIRSGLDLGEHFRFEGFGIEGVMWFCVLVNVLMLLGLLFFFTPKVERESSREVAEDEKAETSESETSTSLNPFERAIAWLKTRWGQDAEIWSGWAEVGIPRLRAIPDALAWGRLYTQETLFWMEVGDNHKSRVQIEEKMRMRMNDALRLSRRTGMKSVFILFGPRWVQDATRWAAIDELPLLLEDWRELGR